MKTTYTTDEVASLLKVTAREVEQLSMLAWGELKAEFQFADIVVLKSARKLQDRHVSTAKISSALKRLREQQSLSSAPIDVVGHELVSRRGESQWNVETGQSLFQFASPPSPPAARTATVVREDADALFRDAVELETEREADAVDLYRRAVAANPRHADAHINLGRLLHQRGRLREAEAHYVAATVVRPEDVTATFNLAVVLDDMNRVPEAISKYCETLRLDPNCVDAYFNVARLYEKTGERMAALRNLKDYRRLSQ